MKFFLLVILLLVLFSTNLTAEEKDFYKLLGVSRDADIREIRKAFKQLAIKLHPDKNINDKDADAKFIQLTKAYDTLKDPDARKHYDLYGETNENKKHQYHSYSYYTDEFGIYDNDPLIVTLSLFDFDNNVNDPNIAWFVNFYSPQCHHCHELAPTWRKLATEMEGIIRIAAVNCEEDWQLCTQLQIRSYPTLLFYDKQANMFDGEKYYEERNIDEFQSFILNRLNLQLETIAPNQWHDELHKKDYLLFLCGDTEGLCPEMKTMLKLMAMFEGLVSVGKVEDVELCKNISSDYTENPTIFWKIDSESNDVKIEGGKYTLTGFDTHDLAKQVLELLPELPTLTLESFQDIRTRLRLGDSKPWLLCFYLGAATELSLQLKRLPALLPDMNIGLIHCARSSGLCASLHVSRYPSWGILKKGGAFEVHHGKDYLHEIVSFARDSSYATNLHALSPADVDNILKHNKPWFIDWYAPWCPPCQRLMPELRRASRHFAADTIQFGTVDCTLHTTFCSKHNIRSYPTTAFYNDSKVHYFHSTPQEQFIVEFVRDMINPVVIDLDSNSFSKYLNGKPADEMWLVEYFVPWCGPCQKFAPQWRALARELTYLEQVRVAHVDCVAESDLCQAQGVRSYPTIRLYPLGSEGLNTVAIYNGHRDKISLKRWLLGFLPSPVMELNSENFAEEVLVDKEPWLIDFYAPWCGHCIHFEPEFITVAQKLDGLVRAGKVNCETHHQLCAEQRVSSYPTVILYVTSSYRYEINSQSSQEIISRVNHILAKQKTLHDEF